MRYSPLTIVLTILIALIVVWFLLVLIRAA